MKPATFLKLRAHLREHPCIRTAIHAAARLPLAGSILQSFANSALRKTRGECWLETSAGWMLLDPLWDGKYFCEQDGEADTSEALRRQIVKGMRVWDIGSHAGFYTLMLAKLVGPTCRVLAIEADPDNARRCEQALIRNALTLFGSVVHCAVCAHMGKARFRRSTAGRMSGKLAGLPQARFGNSEEIEVNATTIDRLMAEHGIPDFVKMDIEGAEAVALEGADKLLQLKRSTLLIEVHDSRVLLSIGTIAEQHGYFMANLERNREAYPLHVMLSPA